MEVVDEVSDTDSEATVVAETNKPTRVEVATAAWRVGFQRGWLEAARKVSGGKGDPHVCMIKNIE